ncbi:hypothetical protein KEJ27_00585 [Candidatus Bathyarchaeota archaeon]|nr:hypothetical protein [Candidatus Bathyarchaeota archaeon]MBS7613324.1 hypothetical protein [Candidatus Bathyarchaeota archaeon]MBS7617009.1 hypothetical protein [Candidatus Bathyarchaeota archaeon]
MHGFRVASLAGIHPRIVYKIMVITSIIALIVTLPFRVLWSHVFGARFPNCWGGFDCDEIGPGSFEVSPPPGEFAIPIIWGFIAIVVLYMFRARFVWFPLHPMGLIALFGASTL